MAPDGPLFAAGTGPALVVDEFGSLQGAIMLASLGNGLAVGALVMVAFALASMPGLLAAPWALKRWRTWQGASADPKRLDERCAWLQSSLRPPQTCGWYRRSSHLA
mgnify:CR=1 FL=1